VIDKAVGQIFSGRYIEGEIHMDISCIELSLAQDCTNEERLSLKHLGNLSGILNIEAIIEAQSSNEIHKFFVVEKVKSVKDYFDEYNVDMLKMVKNASNDQHIVNWWTTISQKFYQIFRYDLFSCLILSKLNNHHYFIIIIFNLFVGM
jgi:hypothetical protein